MNTPIFMDACDTKNSHAPLVQSDRILYTPSDFAKANLIHLQEVGRLIAVKPHESNRSNLSSYLFFLVEKGSGTLTYGGNTYHLKEGDCAFLDCHRAYSHHTSQKLWTLQWVHFYGPNMNAIYEKYVERGGKPCFTCSYAKEYSGLIKDLYDIAASDGYIKDMQIYQRLTVLLTLLMEEGWSTERGAYNSKRRNLQVVKEYLDEHYREKIRLDTLSEKFYINKFYLTRIFKEQFGVSITDYVLQLRITTAKQLLRFSDKTVDEIALCCGMNDASYFSRMFKKIEGVSPGQFRRMW